MTRLFKLKHPQIIAIHWPILLFLMTTLALTIDSHIIVLGDASLFWHFTNPSIIIIIIIIVNIIIIIMCVTQGNSTAQLLRMTYW